MAGSLSGVGAQQIPAANTFKPGEQVRQQVEREPTDSTTQSSEAQGAERSENVLDTQQTKAIKGEDSSPLEKSNVSVSQERGSLLDISV